MNFNLRAITVTAAMLYGCTDVGPKLPNRERSTLDGKAQSGAPYQPSEDCSPDTITYSIASDSNLKFVAHKIVEGKKVPVNGHIPIEGSLILKKNNNSKLELFFNFEKVDTGIELRDIRLLKFVLGSSKIVENVLDLKIDTLLKLIKDSNQPITQKLSLGFPGPEIDVPLMVKLKENKDLEISSHNPISISMAEQLKLSQNLASLIEECGVKTIDDAVLVSFDIVAESICHDKSLDQLQSTIVPDEKQVISKLSQTGFLDTSGRMVSTLTHYSPQYPLWSDGLEKSRWVFLPHDKKIDNTDKDNWVFPSGTVAFKEFRYGGKKIETRMLKKKSEKSGIQSWETLVFKWNEDQTDALLLTKSETLENLAGDGFNYVIPSTADCVSCHEGVADGLIGFSNVQLSKDGDVWNTVLSQPIAKFDVKVRNQNLLDENALGYLHGNCGHCHNIAKNSGGLALRREGNITRFSDEPGYKSSYDTGIINQVTPSQSRMIQRMRGMSMPPLGISKIDENGATLLEDWIADLP